jgi:folate-binding protein YgfZ
VQADLLLADFGDAMLLDVDRFAAASSASELQAFVFSEDVQVEDATAAFARVSLHGAAALVLLGAIDAKAGALSSDLRCVALQVAGHPVHAARRDQAGVPGVELFMPTEVVARVFDALLAAGSTLEAPVRPIGWHAFNVARVEGGTPLFLVDFGREALPHETGLLSRRVSFKKGCYLGQEVVARMESLGKPKQRLVALRMESDRLPVSGATVHLEAADGEAVGTITSSAPAPMLGSACVAFAMLKYAQGEPGTRVRVAAEGDWTTALVQPTLRFLPGGVA